MRVWIKLIGLMMGLLATTPARAACPALVTDCPSPTYNSLVAGNFLVNGSSTAPLAGDAAAITGDLNGLLSPTQIFQNLVHNPAAFNADGLRGAAIQTPGSTITNVNGIAGYVYNQNPNTASGQNAVSVYGVGVANVNGAATWGINVNLTDSNSATATALTGEVLNNEFDFNVTSPNTKVNGLVLQGSSVSQPAAANGFVVSPLNLGTGGVPWDNSFLSNNGAAHTAFFIGTNGVPTLPNLNSQNIAFINTDAAAAQQVTLMSTSLNGLTVTGPGVIVNTVKLTPSTVAALPTCNAAISGSLASVTDATAPAYNATLTGGGAVHTLAFCPGVAPWKAH